MKLNKNEQILSRDGSFSAIKKISNFRENDKILSSYLSFPVFSDFRRLVGL